jgi:hypothetical protein
MAQYVCNLSPSPNDERDLVLESIYPDNVSLPKTYDLRKELPAVRDQGIQGTCSAQTAAAMKEWQENIDIQFREHMSPQFIYNLRQMVGEEGMTPRDTMKILYKIGIVPEKDYPYGKLEVSSGIDLALILKASRYRIAGYAKIGTLDSLKKAIFANGPCYIAFPVYDVNSKEFWKPSYKGQTSLGGHAVTVVGWTKDSFIIRNSWSANWGDNGYTYYKFSDWGMHWEAWTTIDADSSQTKLEEKITDKAGFFKRLFSKKIKKNG